MFYRNIYFTGKENIPLSGPVILAANHPTAFIEPCLMACFQSRSLNFITRGDVFKKPIFDKILRSLHLIPIFRFKDGFANLKQNKDTFTQVHKALKDGKAIFILCEGKTIQEKSLRPIQKGTARMIFGAWEEYQVPEIQVVPVGITYDQADQVFTNVMISCGKALKMSDYLEAYQKEPIATLQKFTDDLRDRLEPEILSIPHKKQEPIVDNLCYLSEPNISLWPTFQKSDIRLRYFQNVSYNFENMQQERKEEISIKLDSISRSLNKYNYSVPSSLQMNSSNFMALWLIAIAILIGIPGLLIFGGPLLIAKAITTKKVYVKEFLSPVRYAMSSFFCLIVAIVLFTIGFCYMAWLSFVPVAILLISFYCGIKGLSMLPWLYARINWLVSSKEDQMQYTSTVGSIIATIA